MVKTFMVINEKGTPVEYFKYRYQAQSYMVKNFDRNLILVAMRGNVFGEGFHHYKMKLNSNLTFRFLRKYEN